MFGTKNWTLFRKPQCDLLKAVNIPIELYESLLGKYFVGYADNLRFGEGKSA